jgi:molecular chaperone HscC
MSVLHEGRPVQWILGRGRFEAISEPLLARLRVPIERTLRDARIDPDALSRIILAGAASQMPAFRRLTARLFRRLPVHQIAPEEVVARGAAVRAGMAAGESGPEETVMTDIAPFTLGIETMVQHGASDGRRIYGQFLPIIERNTVIPASRSKTVSTIDNNQRVMALRVFQGEARQVKDNVLRSDAG